MVLRNEDRLVCHALGWRGNAGNLLVTDFVPHGAHKLGPPAALAHDSASLRQRRTQSFAALPTTPEPDIPMHRAPSPELSTVGTATPHTLQVSLPPIPPPMHCIFRLNSVEMALFRKSDQ